MLRNALLCAGPDQGEWDKCTTLEKRGALRLNIAHKRSWYE